MLSRRGPVGRIAACALFASAMTGQASAQAPAYHRLNASGWVFAPAVLDGYVFGFLAWANTSDTSEDTVSTTGNNITVMWCQRDGTQAWSTWGWGSATIAEAATWVRQLLDAPTVFDKDVQIETLIYEAGTLSNPSAPKEITNGLFWDDPVQAALANAPDPEAFIEALVAIGYDAAPVLSGLDVAIAEACDPTATNALDGALNAFTQEVDTVLFGSSLITQACIYRCRCSTTTGAAAPTSWTCHQYNQNATTVLCDCQNQWTATVTKTGQHWWCTSCATSYPINVKCENAREQFEAPHTCAATPSSTAPTTFTPGTCPGW